MVNATLVAMGCWRRELQDVKGMCFIANTSPNSKAL
jgi:hypothetical protein